MMVSPDLVFVPNEIETWMASLLITLLLVNKYLAESSVKREEETFRKWSYAIKLTSQ